MSARTGEARRREILHMETGKQNKLQFRIDLVLTVLFLLTIFGFLFGTIIFEHGLWGHTFYFRYVSQYLENAEDYTTWELVEASKNSLDTFIAENLAGKGKLHKVNSAFQYLLGKKLVSAGGTQMIRLNTGHFYDMQAEMSLDGPVRDILSIRDSLPEGTPFLFVYEHSTLYEPEAQMPEEYRFMDFSEQNADELMARLRENGVNVIDSREVYEASGLSLEDFSLRTDKHWTTLAAITVTQEIAGRVQELTGREIPTERLEIEQFNAEMYPGLFLGTYGQRLGTRLAEPDDIIVYTPKYETNIHRNTLYNGSMSNAEGSFEKVNLRRDVIKPLAGKTWNIRAYCAYGLVEDYDIMTNEDGADCTILLLKDSFSAPIGRFLSLVADEVYSVDMRNRNGSLRTWIERSNPDIVIVSYSMQMLRSEGYAIE